MITLRDVEFFTAGISFFVVFLPNGWLTFFVMGKQVSPNIGGGQGLLKISSTLYCTEEKLKCE